jgi:hypothetical protein
MIHLYHNIYFFCCGAHKNTRCASISFCRIHITVSWNFMALELSHLFYWMYEVCQKSNEINFDFLTACHKTFGSSTWRDICHSCQLPPRIFGLVPLKRDIISQNIILFIVAFICDLLAYRLVNCTASLNMSAKSWPKGPVSPPLHWPNELRWALK